MFRTKDTYEQNDRQMATRSIQYGPRRKPQKYVYDFMIFKDLDSGNMEVKY